jgi:hypothetical protein
MRTRLLVAFLLPVLAVASAVAQTRVDFFHVDASSFPTVRASFLARDAAGSVVRELDGGSLGIVDGADTARASVEMRRDGSPARLSIVVINQARAHATETHAILESLLQRLEMPGDEIAIVTVGAMLVRDLPFSSIRTTVAKAINALGVSRSGFAVAGLLDTSLGALRLLRDRPGRRIVIIITDVAPPPATDTGSIWRQTVDGEVALHTILIDAVDTTGVFDRFARRTGGSFDAMDPLLSNVDSITARIIGDARELPSKAVWMARPGCALWRECEALVGSRALETRLAIDVPERARPLLATLTPIVTLASSDRFIDTTLTMRAMRWPVTIDAVTIEGKGFALVDSIRQYPIVLQPGDSIVLGVRMQPVDSLYHFGRVSIASNACEPIPIDLSTRGAMPSLPRTRIEVMTPAPGAHVLGGQPVEVHWRNTGRSDSVTIELALGGTQRWDTISAGRTGTSLWWTAPNRRYDSVTFRLRQRAWRTGSAIRQIGGNAGYYGRVTISPDGAVLAAPQGASVHLNGVSDVYFQRRYDVAATVRDADFSATGDSIAIADESGLASILHVADGNSLWWQKFPAPLLASRFSPDGRSLLTLSALPAPRTTIVPSDTLVRIVDIATHEVTLAIAGFSAAQTFAVFAPDGRRIATGGLDGRVRVWDARSGERLLTISAAIGGELQDLRFSPDGAELLTCSGRSARRWNAASGVAIDSIDHGAKVLAADYTFDMASVVTVGEGIPIQGQGFTDRTRIWSMRTGALQLSFPRLGGPISDIAIDRTGSRLFSGTIYGESMLWDADMRDTAVAMITFAVDAPEITLGDAQIDFGVVRLGDTSERTLKNVLINRGTFSAVVSEWLPAGFAPEEIIVVSPARGTRLDPGVGHDVVMRYAPIRPGRLAGRARLKLGDLSIPDDIGLTGTALTGYISTTRTIDLGAVSKGDTLETELRAVIRNESDVEVTIDTVIATGDASVLALLAPSFPRVLAPRSSLDLRLRFTPQVAGPVSSVLRLLGTGDRDDPEITVLGHTTDDPARDTAVDVRVFPNPAHRSAVLLIDVTDDPSLAVQLVDALGRVFLADWESVESASGIALRIDLAGVAPGAYRCRVRLGAGVVGTTGLIVQ